VVSVHVSPSDPDLERAVLSAGARLGAAETADALVCVHDDLEWLRETVVCNPNLRWVQFGAAGIDMWLEAGVMHPHITWTAAKGIHAEAIAEHVMALVYLAAKELHCAARRSSWVDLEVARVAGSTIGVVGAGLTGREVIRLARCNGMRTISLSRSGRDVGADLSLGVEGLSQLLAASDVVVLLCPLTEDTRGLIGDSEFVSMRQTAWLINVGRGPVIDTAALIRALDARQIAGALLDVTDPEPLPEGHELWSRSNVLVTPHVASTPAMGKSALVALVVENTRRFVAGNSLLGTVDLVAGY